MSRFDDDRSSHAEMSKHVASPSSDEAPRPATGTLLGSLAGQVGAGAIQRKLRQRAEQRASAADAAQMAVQMKEEARKKEADAGADDPGAVHAAAAKALGGGGGELPFRDQIQRSFGKHDVSKIEAHTGSSASEGARAMGAEAFASGRHVAFAGSASLHTAAHEAAHVVQQRGGVHLKGGVGEEGDPFERHADEVADLVVKGASAEKLLDKHAGSSGAAGLDAMPVSPGAGGQHPLSPVQKKGGEKKKKKDGGAGAGGGGGAPKAEEKPVEPPSALFLLEKKWWEETQVKLDAKPRRKELLTADIAAVTRDLEYWTDVPAADGALQEAYTASKDALMKDAKEAKDIEELEGTTATELEKQKADAAPHEKTQKFMTPHQSWATGYADVAIHKKMTDTSGETKPFLDAHKKKVTDLDTKLKQLKAVKTVAAGAPLMVETKKLVAAFKPTDLPDPVLTKKTDDAKEVVEKHTKAAMKIILTEAAKKDTQYLEINGAIDGIADVLMTKEVDKPALNKRITDAAKVQHSPSDDRWVTLLGLVNGGGDCSVAADGAIGKNPAHRSRYRQVVAGATNLNGARDAAQTKDDVLGPSGAMSIHVTLEHFGRDSKDNPRAYRGIDAPRNMDNYDPANNDGTAAGVVRTGLRAKRTAFVTDAEGKIDGIHKEKGRGLGANAALVASKLKDG